MFPIKNPVLFLKHAVELAERGRGFVSPNPLVGAVLVRDGQIIAEDWHRQFGEAHAERNLLESFSGDVDENDVLVVTLEPCCHQGKTPPCTEMVMEKGVKKLVVGLRDPNPEVAGKGIAWLREQGIEVVVLQDLAQQKHAEFGDGISAVVEQLKWQNRFFFRWVQQRRPWIALKIAQSLDGRVVPERGKQFWLTGEQARDHVHEQRAQFDAILVGLGTVLADDPMLDLRRLKTQDGAPLGKRKAPQLVILDAALTLPLEKKVVRPGTIIFAGRQFRSRESKKRALEEAGVQVLNVDTTEEGILNLRQVLDELASRGISSVYVEGGAAVWSSFLREGLADELLLYLAPRFLGSGVSSLEEVQFPKGVPVVFRESKVLGDDVFWNGTFALKSK